MHTHTHTRTHHRYGSPPRRGFANASSRSTPASDQATLDIIQEANALMLELWPDSPPVVDTVESDAGHHTPVTKKIISEFSTTNGITLHHTQPPPVVESDADLEQRPWMQTELPPGERAKALLAHMTAAEKLVLLQVPATHALIFCTGSRDINIQLKQR